MNKNRTLFGALTLAATLGLAGNVGAEEVIIPVGSQAARDNVDLPGTGMSQSSVRATWGDPIEIHGPVGAPPITQWHYQDFVVYFEKNRVLHTVLRPQR